MNTKKLFERGSFLRALSLLMSGNFLAVLIGIGTAPIISRLYDPDSFGQFAQFSALLTLFSVAATLRYEDALMLPDDAREAFMLLLTAIASVLFLSLLVLMVSITLLHVEKWQINPTLVWALPLGMCLAGLLQSINSWQTRMKEFGVIAKTSVLRSSSAAISKIGFGFLGLGAPGLIVGQILGEIIALTQAARTLWVACHSHAKGITVANIWIMIKKYKDISIYGSLQILIGAAWIQLPVVFIANIYGSSAAGYYAMALVLIQYPIIIFQNAIRQLFYQRAAEKFNGGQVIYPFYRNITIAIYLTYIIPAAIIFLWGRELCIFIFGSQWVEAGNFAQILVVSSFISIAKIPAIALTKIFRVQKFVIAMDILALILMIILFFVASVYLTIYQMMMMYAGIIGAYNAAIIGWMYIKARRFDINLTRII